MGVRFDQKRRTTRIYTQVFPWALILALIGALVQYIWPH